VTDLTVISKRLPAHKTLTAKYSIIVEDNSLTSEDLLYLEA